MSVIQNECYRLVTIGYLKNLIKNGANTLIQKSDGSYATIASSWDDAYCPTYGQLTGGTILPAYNKATSPKNDTDGLIVSSSAYLGGTYTNNQCVDRHDLSLAYTRLSALQVNVSKSSFDGCGDSGTTEIQYEYDRTTKTMNNCPTTETSITYDVTTSTVSASCSELSLSTTLGSSVSTATCSTYKIAANISSAARTDGVKATVTFRSTSYLSNTAQITQFAGEGSYSIKKSERNVPTGISDLVASPSNYKYEITPSGSACTLTTRSISLGGKGLYNHYETYAYARCGVEDTSVTPKEFLISTDNKVDLTPVTETLSGSGTCCDGNSRMDSKTLTLSWSGQSVSKDFSLICSSCSGSTACSSVEECCQIVGPYSVTCSGTVQYKKGECGCDGTIDLGLSVEWAEYPLGITNYDSYVDSNSFIYYQWGYVDKWTTGGTSHVAYDGDVDPSITSYPYDTYIDDRSTEERDVVKYYLSANKMRMPTKDEAEELLNNTSKQWVTDYKGKSGLDGWLLTSTKTGYTDKSIFLPATGEWYPESNTGGNPWEWHGNGNLYIWLGTGKIIGADNEAAYRLYASANGADNLRIVDSSRRYGNLVFGICDKNM